MTAHLFSCHSHICSDINPLLAAHPRTPKGLAFCSPPFGDGEEAPGLQVRRPHFLHLGRKFLMSQGLCALPVALPPEMVAPRSGRRASSPWPSVAHGESCTSAFIT